MNKKQKNILLLTLSLCIILLFFLLSGPIPQDQSYHVFADARTILNINNALNVTSNIFFSLVGLGGLLLLCKNKPGVKNFRLPYLCFFSGVFLIGIGSSYYHYNPENFTLLLDRLPMTIAFTSLFSAIVSEHINKKLGNYILFPLLAAGIAGVLYWFYTEQKGHGDLRFYIVIQYLPLILIPFIIYLYDSAFTMSRDLYTATAVYIFAKLFEIYDRAIFELNGYISGHTIKHIAAAASIYIILRMLTKRRFIII